MINTEFEYIRLNLNQYKTLEKYFDHRDVVAFGDNTGLFQVEIKTITRNDPAFSKKYEGHTPVVVDIHYTYRVVNKPQFFLCLIKTGISYKIVNNPQ